MGQITTWSLENQPPAITPIETNSLFFAYDVVRYMKFRSTYSIKFCLEKNMTYLFGNQRLVLSAGSYFVTNEGTELECLPSPPGTKGFAVFFTTDLLLDVQRNCTNPDKVLLDDPGSSDGELAFFEHVSRQPSPLLDQLRVLSRQVSTLSSSKNDCPVNTFYLLAQNLFAFQQQTKHQISGINARRKATREELFRRVNAARDYMIDHWNAPLTLEMVARQSCLSPFHFHRSFQKVFGEPPMQWFKKVKLEKSKRLLSDKQCTVSEMALRCGFADVAAFSKAYKRMWGTNPSAV